MPASCLPAGAGADSGRHAVRPSGPPHVKEGLGRVAKLPAPGLLLFFGSCDPASFSGTVILHGAVRQDAVGRHPAGHTYMVLGSQVTMPGIKMNRIATAIIEMM